MFWWLLFVSLILFLYFKLHKINQYWKDRNVLHIKPWPLIGNTLPFFMGQIHYTQLIDALYNTYDARYFGIYLLMQPSLLIKDVELIKQVLIKDFNHFVDHQIFLSQTLEPILKNTLIALEGQDWRDMRTLLSPAFTGSKMRTMFVLINECANRHVDHFVEISKQKTPIILEMKSTCVKYTIDIIASCIFGVECNSAKDEQNEFYKRIKDIINVTSSNRLLKFSGLILCPKLLKLLRIKFFNEDEVNFLRNIVTSTIKFREENNINRPDMIHLLMEARKGRLTSDEQINKDNNLETELCERANMPKQSKINPPELTDDVITSQVLVFSLGTSETTSGILTFALYELAVNQNIQRKLQEEIDKTFESSNENVTYEKLMQMKYLDMVICETLRKWAPLPLLDRICVKSYTIKPIGDEKPLEIKEGDIVHIPIYALHKNPKYYVDPERFDPERFNSENKSVMETLPYLPFGSGPRSCIGNRFAHLVMKTFLSHLLRKFDIIPVERSEIPLQLTKCSVILNIKNGLWLGYKLRIK